MADYTSAYRKFRPQTQEQRNANAKFRREEAKLYITPQDKREAAKLKAAEKKYGKLYTTKTGQLAIKKPVKIKAGASIPATQRGTPGGGGNLGNPTIGMGFPKPELVKIKREK